MYNLKFKTKQERKESKEVPGGLRQPLSHAHPSIALLCLAIWPGIGKKGEGGRGKEKRRE
jgi:hypothetical protein